MDSYPLIEPPKSSCHGHFAWPQTWPTWCASSWLWPQSAYLPTPCNYLTPPSHTNIWTHDESLKFCLWFMWPITQPMIMDSRVTTREKYFHLFTWSLPVTWCLYLNVVCITEIVSTITGHSLLDVYWLCDPSILVMVHILCVHLKPSLWTASLLYYCANCKSVMTCPLALSLDKLLY